MYRQSLGLVAMLAIGMVAGFMGAHQMASSKIEELVAASYLRSASDARSFAKTLEDIRAHKDAQAISRLEGYLSAALISLSDYESVFPVGNREPQIYEALASVRKYVASHAEVTLPPAAERALTMRGTAVPEKKD